MPYAPAVQPGVEFSPIAAQFSVKIEPPRSFRWKNNDDIDTWLSAMDLYFKLKNRILQG